MVMNQYTFVVSKLLYESGTCQHVAQNSLLNEQSRPMLTPKAKTKITQRLFGVFDCY